MNITEKAGRRVVAEAFLTDSIPVEIAVMETLGIDKEALDAELTGRGEPEGEEYLLIPRRYGKQLVMKLHDEDENALAQEILEILDSEKLKTSPKVTSKSFRLDADVYLKLVALAYRQDLSLSNVVKELIRYEIVKFVKEVEESLDVKREKRDFIIEEADSWITNSSPKRGGYKVDLLSPPGFDYQAAEESEPVFVETILKRRMKEEIDPEVPEGEIEELFEELDIKRNLGFTTIENISECEAEGEYYFGYLKPGDMDGTTMEFVLPGWVSLRSPWNHRQEFEAFFEALEHGEELKNTLESFAYIEYEPEQVHWAEDPEIHGPPSDSIQGIDFGEIPYLRFKVTLTEERGEKNLEIEGIPIDDQELKKKLGGKLRKNFDLDDEASLEKLIENDDFKGAQELLEKKEMTKFLDLIAAWGTNFRSQVITISGIKTLILFLQAVTEEETLSDKLENRLASKE